MLPGELVLKITLIDKKHEKELISHTAEKLGGKHKVSTREEGRRGTGEDPEGSLHHGGLPALWGEACAVMEWSDGGVEVLGQTTSSAFSSSSHTPHSWECHHPLIYFFFPVLFLKNIY